MKLTTVKEIYKNREEYLNREVTAVSYTHLDVYKRQLLNRAVQPARA